jgi:hypothetical protein
MSALVEELMCGSALLLAVRSLVVELGSVAGPGLLG